VCIKSAFSPTRVFPQEKPGLVSRPDAEHVQTLQTWCRLDAHFYQKSLRLADYADFAKVCMFGMQTFFYEVQSLHKVSNQRE
jgi:hypothetical protein